MVYKMSICPLMKRNVCSFYCSALISVISTLPILWNIIKSDFWPYSSIYHNDYTTQCTMVLVHGDLFYTHFFIPNCLLKLTLIGIFGFNQKLSNRTLLTKFILLTLWKYASAIKKNEVYLNCTVWKRMRNLIHYLNKH